jgi:hypothetical protein
LAVLKGAVRLGPHARGTAARCLSGALEQLAGCPAELVAACQAGENTLPICVLPPPFRTGCGVREKMYRPRAHRSSHAGRWGSHLGAGAGICARPGTQRRNWRRGRNGRLGRLERHDHCHRHHHCRHRRDGKRQRLVPFRRCRNARTATDPGVSGALQEVRLVRTRHPARGGSRPPPTCTCTCTLGGRMIPYVI